MESPPFSRRLGGPYPCAPRPDMAFVQIADVVRRPSTTLEDLTRPQVTLALSLAALSLAATRAAVDHQNGSPRDADDPARSSIAFEHPENGRLGRGAEIEDAIRWRDGADAWDGPVR